MPSPPMMIMNSTWKERSNRRRAAPRSRAAGKPTGPRDADIEGGDRERRELRMERPDADDLGGDVHVAHRHPHAADPPAHQVLGGEREHHHDREDER